MVEMGSWRLVMPRKEGWTGQCNKIDICPTGTRLSKWMRHEYRELHEEPQRDTSGALLPSEVGCEPGRGCQNLVQCKCFRECNKVCIVFVWLLKSLTNILLPSTNILLHF